MAFGFPEPMDHSGRGICPSGCHCKECQEWRERNKKIKSDSDYQKKKRKDEQYLRDHPY